MQNNEGIKVVRETYDDHPAKTEYFQGSIWKA